MVEVRYPDGGGLTAEGRARREAVRLQAAALFARDVPVPEIAARLRVSHNAVYVWRRRWLADGDAGLASKGPSGTGCRLSADQLHRWTRHGHTMLRRRRFPERPELHLARGVRPVRDSGTQSGPWLAVARGDEPGIGGARHRRPSDHESLLMARGWRMSVNSSLRCPGSRCWSVAPDADPKKHAAGPVGSLRGCGWRDASNRTGGRTYEEGGLSHVRHARCARVLPG